MIGLLSGCLYLPRVQSAIWRQWYISCYAIARLQGEQRFPADDVQMTLHQTEGRKGKGQCSVIWQHFCILKYLSLVLLHSRAAVLARTPVTRPSSTAKPLSGLPPKCAYPPCWFVVCFLCLFLKIGSRATLNAICKQPRQLGSERADVCCRQEKVIVHTPFSGINTPYMYINTDSMAECSG